MLLPNLSTRRFRRPWRMFALCVLCCAAVGVVLGNVAAHAVCVYLCSECVCFKGVASGTHYKITDSETTVYRRQYWTDGYGVEAGRQILMFRRCPSTPVCTAIGILNKLECGPEVEGDAYTVEGPTQCVNY